MGHLTSMYNQKAISILDSLLERIANVAREVLRIESGMIETWRWDHPIFSYQWLGSDHISRNINITINSPQISKSNEDFFSQLVILLDIEVNGWQDTDVDNMRVRKWRHLPVYEALELNVLNFTEDYVPTKFVRLLRVAKQMVDDLQERDLKRETVQGVLDQRSDFALEDFRHLLEEKSQFDQKRSERRLSIPGTLLYDGSLHHANLADLKISDVSLAGGNFFAASFFGSTLSNANLTRSWLNSATFNRARLNKVDLSSSYLYEADFSASHLESTAMQNCVMTEAKLDNAELIGVDFSNSDLSFASLKDARVFSTDYSSIPPVNFSGANLTQADLLSSNQNLFNDDGLKMNGETILPDGSYWSPKVDLARFTNVHHPDFWRSSDPSSPAYGG